MLDTACVRKESPFCYSDVSKEIQTLLAERRAKMTAARENGEVPEGVDWRLCDDNELPAGVAVHQIQLDLHRTFYTHEMFKEEDGAGQQSLFRLLCAYARYCCL